MDFFAVFSFFSGNSELTPQQRLSELICVSVLAVLLTAVTTYVLYQKIKILKTEKTPQKTETESEHDGRKEQ